MPYFPVRFTAVPWLSNALDLRPGSSPAWEAQPDGDHLTRGWRILSPWTGEDQMLIIHAVKGNGNDGGIVTLRYDEAVPAPLPVREPQGSVVRIEDPFPPDAR